MDLVLPLWFEIGSLIVLTLILVGDLLLILKRPHIPSTRESTLWVVFYVTLALIFAGIMWIIAGPEYAGQFVAGWLTEYSLSIDNLFVFVLIMSQFAVPRRYQQEVLMVGIIIALILRGRVHPRRRRRHRAVQLGVLHLRRLPGVDGVAAGVPRRRSTTTRCRPRTSSCARCVDGSTSATTTTARSCAPSSTARRCGRR